jgi:hypothetical protein
MSNETGIAGGKTTKSKNNVLTRHSKQKRKEKRSEVLVKQKHSVSKTESV